MAFGSAIIDYATGTCPEPADFQSATQQIFNPRYELCAGVMFGLKSALAMEGKDKFNMRLWLAG
jgi:hypothetical protein